MKKFLFPLILSLVLAVVVILLFNYFSIDRVPLLEGGSSSCKHQNYSLDFSDCSSSGVGLRNLYGWPLNFRYADERWGNNSSPSLGRFYFGNFILDYLLIFILLMGLIWVIKHIIKMWPLLKFKLFLILIPGLLFAAASLIVINKSLSRISDLDNIFIMLIALILTFEISYFLIKKK